MLEDLKALAGYFDGPETLLYEEDLIRRYGGDAVSAALETGLLDHGWIPCGRGRRRCVCRLSEKGKAVCT